MAGGGGREEVEGEAVVSGEAGEKEEGGWWPFSSDDVLIFSLFITQFSLILCIV